MSRSVGLVGIVASVMVSTMPTADAQTRRPTTDQWDQVRPLFALVEEVAAGKSAPSDVTLAWQNHFLNANAGVVLVPFTLKIERGEFVSFPLAMYLRVVTRGSPAPAPGPRDALAQYPFEDAAMFDRPTDGRISRAFTAPPGEYDVYVGLREKPTTERPDPRTVVLKRNVRVPDLTSGLAVSSIIMADKIEVDSSNKRPSFEEQLDDPYVLWGARLTPAFRSTFGRHEKLSVMFLVYNTGATANDKPDVDVQYQFLQKAGPIETSFIRAPMEVFNARTLRPEFSLRAGDLVVAGQQWPLGRFPDGEYRLEITVTDHVTRTSLTRAVSFTVAGG